LTVHGRIAQRTKQGLQAIAKEGVIIGNKNLNRIAHSISISGKLAASIVPAPGFAQSDDMNERTIMDWQVEMERGEIATPLLWSHANYLILSTAAKKARE
jgi:hypothetical protein